MKTKLIKTEHDYNEACERIYHLINSTDEAIDPDSPEGEEIELLSILVEKYEQEQYPIDAPNPISAIKFRMEQMNLKQSDIASLFGGKTRISEVLHGKRSLTLKMITLLNRYLGIPLESLIAHQNNIDLDSEKKKELLHISSINNYISSFQAAKV